MLKLPVRHLGDRINTAGAGAGAGGAANNGAIQELNVIGL